MIQSMTGYGKAVVTFKEKKINVEIKSLNSKALDLSARIAPLYREKEMDIRQKVAKSLERGKVDFAIWIEKDDVVDAASINAALVENYYKQIKNISLQTGIPEPTDWYATLLALPDITTKTENEELTNEEWAVASELIYYIEKLDISEEKQRLTNHLNYFRETMQEEGHGVGKKLGFIAQEMGREINTTGSKSNQAEMQNIVVKMKDELEQIKEQVLNAL